MIKQRVLLKRWQENGYIVAVVRLTYVWRLFWLFPIIRWTRTEQFHHTWSPTFGVLGGTWYRSSDGQTVTNYDLDNWLDFEAVRVRPAPPARLSPTTSQE